MSKSAKSATSKKNVKKCKRSKRGSKIDKSAKKSRTGPNYPKSAKNVLEHAKKGGDLDSVSPVCGISFIFIRHNKMYKCMSLHNFFYINL